MTKDRSETDSLPGVPPGEGPPQATVFAGRGWLSQLDSWGASGTGGEGGRPICLGRAPSAGVDSVLLEEPVDLPAPGASFLGFEVIAELGRGAFGRVYLARQGDLANRLVALKVSTEMVEESQKLAQLQHTHIVPLYSLHQAGRLQAVCMPYLGSTTLADVLEQVMQGPELPVSGRQLVSTVQNRRSRTWQSLESHRSAEEIAPPGGPDTALAPASSRLPEPLVRDTLHRLEGLSYPEAILWIGARLADGLAHAHERGIVHRDLKPANVLLTDEGQPMLLDFNLSEDARGGRVEAARVGGTLPYMAPEHLEAFQGAPRAVDARSDIYSLGVMLFELLTGRHPFGRHQGPTQVILPRMLEERRAGAPSLRQWSPALSPATEQIVRTCLHPDPAQRYPSARALQEDLERQLADLPLRHVREPSPRERARKWVRRHPRLASSGTAAGVAAVLLLLLGLAFAQRGRQVQRLEALDAAEAFQKELAAVRLLLSARTGDPPQRDEGLGRARAALERYGVLSRDDWQQQAPFTRLPPERQEQLRREAGEMVLLLASSLAQEGGDGGEPADRLRQAVALNERAERSYPADQVPRALWLQRAGLMDRLGAGDQAAAWRAHAGQTPVRTPWERYMLAREHVVAGKVKEAVEALREAVRHDPRLTPAWYLLGGCALQGEAGLGEKDALTAYTACIALEPGFHGQYINRGLAHLRLRAHAEAEEDFTRALQLRPDVAQTYLHRGMARQGRGRDAEALADFDQAVARGWQTNRAYLARARLRERLGDLEGARLDRREGITRVPGDEESWVARGIARHRDDPEGALADFAEAVRLNPRSLPGLHNQAHLLAERMGRTREAIARLDRVLQLHPDMVPSLGGRAVLWARLGERARAHRDVERVLKLSQSGETLFQAAGVYALTSRQNPEDRREALRLLGEALVKGFGIDLLERDRDLAALRDDSAFQELCRNVQTLRRLSKAGTL